MRRFVLYSQLNQAEALKTAVTHWRSRMFKTSGCLIWQLNDCWPVVSWSLIDYNLNPKPSYFTVKRCFKPVIAPLIVKQGKVYVYIVNETNKDLELNFRFEFLRFNGERFYAEHRELLAPAYTSSLAFESDLDKLPIADDCILAATLESNGVALYEDSKTFKEPKDLKLPNPNIKFSIKQVDARSFEVLLESAVYAKAVHLETIDLAAEFDDNFFDLMPNRPRSVKCRFKDDVSLSSFKEAFLVEAYPY
jgi:beta-mannosidase